jgi:hypothetical protein
MGEEFYCLLKLVSGEEVFSLISIDDSENENPIIIMQNPVIMKLLTTPKGSHLKVKPWIELSNEDIFIIRLDKVMTMTEIRDKKIIDIYKNYNSELNDYSNYEDQFVSQRDGRVPISKEMGYLSSVESFRNILEKMFKNSKDTKDN